EAAVGAAEREVLLGAQGLCSQSKAKQAQVMKTFIVTKGDTTLSVKVLANEQAEIQSLPEGGLHVTINPGPNQAEQIKSGLENNLPGKASVESALIDCNQAR